jgi:hypothetical protein
MFYFSFLLEQIFSLVLLLNVVIWLFQHQLMMDFSFSRNIHDQIVYLSIENKKNGD